jgi:23S rRNA (cytosine1962-C5)-methyltransferase
LSFAEGYSHGLFLDQRDNRRRFARNHVAADFDLLRAPGQSEVLNLFAYTCGFSVSAATTGARTTSIDLSKKYLDWGRRNFAANRLDVSPHEFLAGDAFDWLGRFQRQGRRFDAIVLDPPTFSRSKQSGAFRAQADYPKLIAGAVAVLKTGGVLLACNNAARVTPVDFVAATRAAVTQAGRQVRQLHYVPQPPDFPITRAEPAHLKTLWLRLD